MTDYRVTVKISKILEFKISDQGKGPREFLEWLGHNLDSLEEITNPSSEWIDDELISVVLIEGEKS